MQNPNRKFVIVTFEVHCSEPEKFHQYRVWVNDELFTERTFRWKDHYLVERLQIQARPGAYHIRFDPLTGVNTFVLKDFRVELGPGRIKNRTLFIGESL